MKTLEFFKFIRAIKRIRKVSVIFVKHGFLQLITNIGLSKFFIFRKYLKVAYPVEDFENVPGEVRVRYAVEELGPAFIKLGQMLSQEVSIVPISYSNELRKLQDSVELNRMEFPYIREFIKKELGKDIEEIFLSFDEFPVASASLAQVHKAVLKDGTNVAVKIKKQGVEKIVESDLNVLYFILKVIKNPVKELLYIDNLDEIYNEFNKTIKGELDFLQEAGFTEKSRRYNINNNLVVIPRIYWNYSTRSLLVEEFIDGIKIMDKDELAKQGYNTKKILRVLLNHFYKQFFIFGFFNADPHPGNIFVMDESRIGVIDFGSVGILAKDLRHQCFEYLFNFINGNYEEVATIFINICSGDLTEREERDFRYELMEFIEGFSAKPFKDIYSAELFLDTLKIARHHNLKIPVELSLLFKALLSIEFIAKILDPDFTFITAGEGYFDFNELTGVKEKTKNIKEDIVSGLKSYKNFFTEFPNKAEKIMKKMSDDSFSIDFNHKGLDGLINEMEKSSKRLASSLILITVIISSTVMMFFGNASSNGLMLTMGSTGWIIAIIYLLVIIFK